MTHLKKTAELPVKVQPVGAAARHARGSRLARLAAAAQVSPVVQRLETVKRRGSSREPGVVQRAAYSVTRDLPLETHYSLISADNARKTMLNTLRNQFPLDPIIEQQAKSEKWDNARKDQSRAPEFAVKKRELEQQVSNAPAQYADTDSGTREPGKKPEEQPYDVAKLWVAGAHVKGLRVASDRGRKNTPESALTKQVTGTKDWTGAHLIKREWGGEDNMLNVVCWPDQAEKDWGTGFEEPVELAFATRARREVDISVRVDKEDEAIKREDIADTIKDATADPTTKLNKHILGKAEVGRMDANRGIERIPVAARGHSALGTVSFDKSVTKWDEARTAALKKLQRTLTGMKHARFDDEYIPKDPSEHARDAQGTRTAEREEAAREETYNYRKDIYKVT
ncbi:hypothetical protein [Roseobacter sp. S98]|uniref:hypothetical protein n=1 Tax=Roseobacter algicola (ex Choi et al. 2025) (nom. illeg.) TaxID=3092138 RepID=UPI003F511EB1